MEANEQGTKESLDYQVKINGAAISPSPLNVPTDINVYFKNVGPNVAAIYGNGPDGDWGTGDIAPGDETYTYFSTAGTYIYQNTEANGSRGVIIASNDAAAGGKEINDRADNA